MKLKIISMYKFEDELSFASSNSLKATVKLNMMLYCWDLHNFSMQDHL